MTAAEQEVPDSGAAVSLPIRANGSDAAPASSSALTGKQEHCAFVFVFPSLCLKPVVALNLELTKGRMLQT